MYEFRNRKTEWFAVEDKILLKRSQESRVKEFITPQRENYNLVEMILRCNLNTLLANEIESS